MWPRGVETKGKMTLEKPVKVNNGSSMDRMIIVAFFMCVCVYCRGQIGVVW